MKPSFSSLSLQLIRMRFKHTTSNMLNKGSNTPSYLPLLLAPVLQKINPGHSKDYFQSTVSTMDTWLTSTSSVTRCKKIALFERHLSTLFNFYFPRKIKFKITPWIALQFQFPLLRIHLFIAQCPVSTRTRFTSSGSSCKANPWPHHVINSPQILQLPILQLTDALCW